MAITTSDTVIVSEPSRQWGRGRLVWRTHPVLGHTGLKFPDLGVWSWDGRAFPFLLHTALPLQLLELQILIGALGCIQLLSDLRVGTQGTGDWIPNPEEGVSWWALARPLDLRGKTGQGLWVRRRAEAWTHGPKGGGLGPRLFWGGGARLLGLREEIWAKTFGSYWKADMESISKQVQRALTSCTPCESRSLWSSGCESSCPCASLSLWRRLST
jgi:hypothetical protein